MSPAALFTNTLSLVILCYLILCAAVIIAWIGTILKVVVVYRAFI